MLITVDLHAHEDDFPDILVKGIHDMTYGNPYWCKELAHFIIIRGQVAQYKETSSYSFYSSHHSLPDDSELKQVIIS